MAFQARAPAGGVLRRRLDVGFECFASPLNAYLTRVRVGLLRRRQPFGSRGSFFALPPMLSGSFAANPPFEHSIMDATAAHRGAPHRERRRRRPRALVRVFVPGWKEGKAYAAMAAPKFLRRRVLVAAAENGFCDGASAAGDPYRKSPYDTVCFVLQTAKAARKWPVGDGWHAPSRRSSAPRWRAPSARAGGDAQKKRERRAEKSAAGGGGGKKRKKEKKAEAAEARAPRRRASERSILLTIYFTETDERMGVSSVCLHFAGPRRRRRSFIRTACQRRRLAERGGARSADGAESGAESGASSETRKKLAEPSGVANQSASWESESRGMSSCVGDVERGGADGGVRPAPSPGPPSANQSPS